MTDERKELLSNPISPFDPSSDTTVAGMVHRFSEMSMQARNLGVASQIMERAMTDPVRPTIFLGLAGPLIAAGLRETIRQLVDRGMVDVIVSTGAVMYQDYYQSQGGRHHKGDPRMDDSYLRSLHIDRIYDTLIDDDVVMDCDHKINAFMESLPPGVYSSSEFTARWGETIEDGSSILATAARKGVPVFIPAINDSSIGIGMTPYVNDRLHLGSDERVVMDSIKDNALITDIIVNSPATAGMYIGGGVPKNFINDAVVMATFTTGKEDSGHSYVIQISTALMQDGGLSGSTLSEAKSWGKVEKEANTAMVFSEASIALPLLVGYLAERVGTRDRDVIPSSIR